MKKLLTVILCLCLVCFSVSAADGSVTYSGDAGEFIFAPGSEESLTDLFPNFKDVMPGDSLHQKITVKNDASEKVKVNIYVRSKGAQAGSEEFLSQLRLRVAVSEDNVMGYMFDAAASETAQLTEWVLLGTLYSGGEVNLDVTLDVPVEMGNEFQNQIGYLEWEFMVEEMPIDPDDPTPPTGDQSYLALIVGTMVCSAIVIAVLLPLVRRRKKED